MSLNVFYCGNCTVDLIPIYFQRNTSFKMSRIRHRNYIGDGPNSTFSRICTETREYVMSMTAVITYIKVAIVRTMSSNKVKFHKLMFLFQIKFHS